MGDIKGAFKRQGIARSAVLMLLAVVLAVGMAPTVSFAGQSATPQDNSFVLPVKDQTVEGTPSYVLGVTGTNCTIDTDADGNTLRYDSTLQRYEVQYSADSDFNKEITDDHQTVWTTYDSVFGQINQYKDLLSLTAPTKMDFSFNLKLDSNLSVDQSKLTVTEAQREFAADNPDWDNILEITAVTYDETNHAIHVVASFVDGFDGLSLEPSTIDRPSHLVLKSPEGAVYLPADKYNVNGTARILESKACMSEHIDTVKLNSTNPSTNAALPTYINAFFPGSTVGSDHVIVSNYDIVCKSGGVQIALAPTLTPQNGPDFPNIVKAVSGASTGSAALPKFTFTLTPHGDNPAGGCTGYASTADITGAGQLSDAFGTATFGKAGTYKFDIAEQQGSEAGWTYSTAKYTWTVIITSVDGALSVGDTSLIDASGTVVTDAAFDNSYAPTPVSEASPDVTKTITGTVPDGSMPDFFFAIAAHSDNPANGCSGLSETATIKGADVADNKATAKTAFGTAQFTSAGTYVFDITETAAKKDGWTYDDSSYIWTVTVADVDSKLKITASTLTKNGKDADSAAFNNTFKEQQGGGADGSGTQTKAATTTGKKATTAKTGDTAPIAPLAFVGAGAAALALLALRRKDRAER